MYHYYPLYSKSKDLNAFKFFIDYQKNNDTIEITKSLGMTPTLPSASATQKTRPHRKHYERQLRTAQNVANESKEQERGQTA